MSVGQALESRRKRLLGDMKSSDIMASLKSKWLLRHKIMKKEKERGLRDGGMTRRRESSRSM